MEGLDEFKALSYLNQTEGLGLRFHTLVAKASLDEFTGNGIRTGFGDEFLRVGPLNIPRWNPRVADRGDAAALRALRQLRHYLHDR